jgi:hypothetical protein
MAGRAMKRNKKSFMNPMICARNVWDREWFQNLLALSVATGVFFFIAYYDFSEREFAGESEARRAFEQLLSSHLEPQTSLDRIPDLRLRDLGNGCWELNGVLFHQEGGNRLLARAQHHRKSGWHLHHLEIGNRSVLDESRTPKL